MINPSDTLNYGDGLGVASGSVNIHQTRLFEVNVAASHALVTGGLLDLEERGTIGFYVERRQNRLEWQRVSDEMLPGLITAQMGGEYLLAAPNAASGHSYQYRLIEQEARGTIRHYGPFSLEMKE